ncbi:MAG: tetratricopeptide repeat protein, partial [Verrucomicrobiales bacterium]
SLANSNVRRPPASVSSIVRLDKYQYPDFNSFTHIMKNSEYPQISKLQMILLICGMAAVPSLALAGAPAPQLSESKTLAYVQKLREATDEVMPGDQIPRRVRLTEALYSLAQFHNNKKAYEKADKYYTEVSTLINEDKSEWRLGNLRYYSDAIAKDYLQRGDLVKSKPYIDTALKICREDSKQKEVLPSVLTTLARWQKQSMLSKEAESTLLEAIGILGDYGFFQRKELAHIYLETNQLAKADKTITELEKSTYADSSGMFLRANWLRATGRISEADELETKARAKKAEEIEKKEKSQ